MLQIGDRVLTKCQKGYKAIGSELIAWWLHSRWSHIMPVVSEDGDVLDITIPRPKIVSLKEHCNGAYRMVILRPVTPFDENQKKWFKGMAECLAGREYDLISFVGFLRNANTQDPSKVNCAEGTLLCDQAAGLLTSHDGKLISPQSYDDYATAGLFKVIYGDAYPTPDDFDRLVSK